MSPRRTARKRIAERSPQGEVGDTSAHTHGSTRRFKGSRRTNLALAAAAVLAVSLALLSSFIVLSSLRGKSGSPPASRTAAIIDQVVLTFPGPAFIERATDLLETSGYRVDHYSGGAEAFVHKGAKVVAGWDSLVSASQTDAATERLLQHLVVDGLSVEEAVQRTGKEVGPDPGFNSSLLLYLSPG
jgi:hypothetical protein